MIGLSCYLPIRHELQKYAAKADPALPVFLAHGSYDDVVSPEFAQIARELLEQRGFTIDWKMYPCAHTVCLEEIEDIRTWLLKCWKS